jgi:two-component system chemotaxis sensor kinase CheA
MDDLSQYQELYVQTSKEYIQALNASLLVLEKNSADKTAIEDTFRNAHSLKSQSAAMGYQGTGYLCHVIEDVFYEIKQGRMTLKPELADHLFDAFDALGDSIARIEKESQEADLTAITETIKQLSGVKTTGAGKSERGDTPAGNTPAPDASPAPTPPPAKDPQPATSAAPPTEGTKPAATTHAPVNTIAVKVDVLDEMMNLLENFLVERLKAKRLSGQLVDEYPELREYFDTSEKILASLQYQIMKARAVPVSLVFDHFPRAVRDLARTENKQIELVVTGSDLELDRTIVDRLDEPLIHLLRNAVSHGIKDKGTIYLSAERQKDYAQISVSDDGQGIDWQQVAQKAGLAPNETNTKLLRDALFSGISTSSAVTQISGRGVGLMAIKKMVDNFGGIIDVASETGKGATFTIKLPLTLAIAKALMVVINQGHFAIPTLGVERIVEVPLNSIKRLADQEAIVLDEREVPLIRLSAKLALPAEPAEQAASAPSQKNLLAVIIDEGGDKVGLVVDAVLETATIVIKPVPDVLKGVRGFSGVTILSDGRTALLINTQELL